MEKYSVLMTVYTKDNPENFDLAARKAIRSKKFLYKSL